MRTEDVEHHGDEEALSTGLVPPDPKGWNIVVELQKDQPLDPGLILQQYEFYVEELEETNLDHDASVQCFYLMVFFE